MRYFLAGSRFYIPICNLLLLMMDQIWNRRLRRITIFLSKLPEPTSARIFFTGWETGDGWTMTTNYRRVKDKSTIFRIWGIESPPKTLLGIRFWFLHEELEEAVENVVETIPRAEALNWPSSEINPKPSVHDLLFRFCVIATNSQAKLSQLYHNYKVVSCVNSSVVKSNDLYRRRTRSSW